MEYSPGFERFIRDKTMNRLCDHLEYANKQGVPKEKILGIFCYGSQNYHFADRDSDVDSRLIIVPSYDDICFEQKWVSQELHTLGEHIDVKDIRELRNQFLKQNISFLEILYTDYFIINPKYEKIWNAYFVENREIITHYDKSRTVSSINNQITHLLKKNPTNNKALYNAHRLYYFLENYLNNKVYIECIRPTGESYEFLRELKFGVNKLSLGRDEDKIKDAAELQQKLKDLLSMYDNLDFPLQEDALKIVNAGVKEIIEISIQRPSAGENGMTKDKFFQQLTNAEQKAFYSIIKEIGIEGNIIISKLINKNAISRPVYSNLLSKMKQYSVATVANQGVKGIKVKILNPELKAEAMKFM